MQRLFHRAPPATPVTPRGAPCQNAPAKGFSCNSLPQSKRALREPPRMQPLATVPTPGGPPLRAQ